MRSGTRRVLIRDRAGRSVRHGERFGQRHDLQRARCGDLKISIYSRSFDTRVSKVGSRCPIWTLHVLNSHRPREYARALVGSRDTSLRHAFKIQRTFRRTRERGRSRCVARRMRRLRRSRRARSISTSTATADLPNHRSDFVLDSKLGRFQSDLDFGLFNRLARSVALQNTLDRPKPATVSTILEDQRNYKSRPAVGRCGRPRKYRPSYIPVVFKISKKMGFFCLEGLETKQKENKNRKSPTRARTQERAPRAREREREKERERETQGLLARDAAPLFRVAFF